MILEYHRPDNLDEALRLLDRDMPHTLPLAGGTFITGRRDEDIAVVDLQDLGLDYLTSDGNHLHIGAMSKLQAVVDSHLVHASIRQAVQAEFSSNIRQMATIGGEIVTCDGRSVLTTAFLAMDAKLIWMPDNHEVPLGNYLPLRPKSSPGKLIREVILPSNGDLRIEKVARSPVDLAIIAVSVFRWHAGRTRIALGGFGPAPVMVLDGPDATGAEAAVLDAYRNADDEWASGEYRSQVAAQITRKLIGMLDEG